MDNVLTESKTSAEPALARDILENNKWKLNDALDDFKMILKQNLMETNLDDNSDTVHKKCDLIVKSNSHPSLNTTTNSTDEDTTTVIEETTKVPIRLNNKSLDKLTEIKSTEKSKSDPPVQKTKLFRGISRATDNIHIVSKVRGDHAQDFQAIKDTTDLDRKFNLDLPFNTQFTLPDISIHPQDFRQFLEKDLIEKSTLTSLKTAKRLNWWSDELNIAQKLWPLSTTGDGNCLLHACSLALFGFHDRLLTLRKALHYYLISNSTNVDTFYKRWRWQCTLENKKAGLILSEEEWTDDWSSLLKMASTEPRLIGSNYVKTTKTIELNGGKKDVCEEEFANHVYESLEEIHILALAHVLKRPIVVIADTVLRDVKNEPFSPIYFGGIYLPYDIQPEECNRSPLCLTYDAAHFSSLVAMDHESYADADRSSPIPPAVIPLVDFEGKLLQVQFIVEPPNDLNWDKMNQNDDLIIDKLSISERDKIDLLDKYLDLVYIDKKTKESFTSEEFKKKQSKEVEVKDETDHVKIENTLNPTQVKQQSNSTQLSPPKSKESTRKKLSFNLGSLRRLTIRFSSLKRSMSKRFKRNVNIVNAGVNNLVRRSSFRLSRRSSMLNKTESQTKSTNNLDTTAISTNSLNSPVATNQKIVEKSPSKLSTKSTKSSISKSPSKSINSSTADQSKSEESIIPNNFILAADMHIDNQPAYRDEFIRNYLSTARLRFLNECDSRSTTEKSVQQVNSSEYSSHKGSTVSSNTSLNSTSSNFKDDYAQCVNMKGCLNFGKSSTNYLCDDCLTLQKKELIEIKTNFESTIN